MLRLVNDRRGSQATTLLRRDAAGAIARETRAAAGLGAGDARWVLAVRVAQTLEGERQAILRPERRARLMRTASLLGLRPFDASLIIAIVQDGRRTFGEDLGPAVEQRLGMVRSPQRGISTTSVVLQVAASVMLAAVFMLLLVRWLAGG